MKTETIRVAGQPWSLDDAAEFLGISPRSMTRLTASGRLRTIRVGGRVLVPDAEIRKVAEHGIPAKKSK